MDWRYNTIWFEQIESNNYLNHDFKEKKEIATNFTDVEYAILWHLKSGANTFENLPSTNNLLYLELNWANAKNLQGINKFKNLKRLELHYCPKLEEDLGIAQLGNSLQYLHINQSKKFKFTDELLSLTNLRTLCLNACGPIDDLSFLSNFPNLIDFRFVDTNIISVDLTPLINHPTIRTVGFLNKRHYNIKDIQLKNDLLLKSDVEYRHFAYKGEYRTARYNY